MKNKHGGGELHKIFILLPLFSFCFCQDEGLKAYQSGDFDAARKYYESILQDAEDNSSALYGLGTTAYQQKDYEKALDAFNKIQKTDQTDLKSKVLYNLGNTLAAMKNNEEAIEYYRQALVINPHDKDAKHNYEILRYIQKQENQKNKQKESKQNKSPKNQKQEKNQQNKERKQPNKDQPSEKKDDNQKSDQKKDQDPQQKNSQYKKDQQKQAGKSDKDKNQDLQNAQAILDALKKDEKVNQRRQMVRTRSKKLEKDW